MAKFLDLEQFILAQFGSQGLSMQTADHSGSEEGCREGHSQEKVTDRTPAGTMAGQSSNPSISVHPDSQPTAPTSDTPHGTDP